MNILISVIVPLYNYKHFVGDCIKSILNQTYKNFELIIVDDCSTDNSYSKAKKYETKDKRVKVIKLGKNSGYSKAKNEGIVLSKGEYIVTLDADDMMLKNSLEIRLHHAVKHNVQFIYADAIKVKGNVGLEKCYNINIEQLRKKRTEQFNYDPSEGIYHIHAQSIMIKREIFIKYGLFDESLRSRSDREMWWRLFGKDEKDPQVVTSYYIPQPVAYYRNHPNSMWRIRKRRINKKLDEEVIRKSEVAYIRRKKQGITKENTRFLEK